jgi:pantothenate kinase
MEAIYQSLAETAITQYEALKIRSAEVSPRLLIAVAGPPGSGKTTSTTAIAALINAKTSSSIATVVSMDGFHWPRSYLDKLANREEAYIRRGAPWTFDAESIVALVHQLRTADADVCAPTFDHAAKDPVANGLLVPAMSKIVFLEGNYLLVDENPWCKVKELVDMCWLVTVDQDVARLRVASRHVAAGIEKDMENALGRVDRNDTLNGLYIMEHSRASADVLIESIDNSELNIRRT